MAIKAIQKYLAQPVHNYLEGRLLFERYSSDKALSLLFRTGSSDYHHNRLLSALEELSHLEEHPPVFQKGIQKVPKKVIPRLEDFDVPTRKVKEDDYKDFPAQIQEVVRTKNMHYKRAQQLFIEIGFTEDQERRLEMALVLLNDHQQVQECWAVIDEYREKGQILVERKVTLEEEVNSIAEVDLYRALNNLRANISKDKKKLDTLPDGHKKAKVLLRYQSNLLKQDLLLKKIGGTDV